MAGLNMANDCGDNSDETKELCWKSEYFNEERYLNYKYYKYWNYVCNTSTLKLWR